MKLNLSNFSKSSLNSIPFSKQMYPINAKVIQLAEHKLKRKPASYNSLQKPYYTQKNIRKISKKNLLSRYFSLIDKEIALKSILLCSTICSLLAIFLFVGQIIPK